MAKMRKTFLNIAGEITEKRQQQRSAATKKEHRFRLVKASLAVLLTTAIICIGFYISRGMMNEKKEVITRLAPQWTELSSESQEYAEAICLVDAVVNQMRRKGTDGLKDMWSFYSPPENIYHYEETLSLYKGEELLIQSVKEKADASKKFVLICKSPNNGHRLKISFRKENGIIKLSGADMIP